jgi:ketosteroid isomerase-like protein
MPERDSPEAVVEALFATTDNLDTEAKLRLVTDDVMLRFGNEEPASGKAALKAVSDEFNRSVRGISHEITGLWTVSGSAGEDLVFTELRVSYSRLDGRELVLPCFNVFRVRGGLISDYRIYMDMTPVYT